MIPTLLTSIPSFPTHGQYSPAFPTGCNISRMQIQRRRKELDNLIIKFLTMMDDSHSSILVCGEEGATTIFYKCATLRRFIPTLRMKIAARKLVLNCELAGV